MSTQTPNPPSSVRAWTVVLAALSINLILGGALCLGRDGKGAGGTMGVE